MGVFIDTGIFVAIRNADDKYHEKAKNLMRRALKGEFGLIYTSNFIFDEAVTVALVRTKRIDLAIDVGNYILSSRRIRMIFVDQVIFEDSWKIMQKYSDKMLSFTDATTIAIMRRYGIFYLMSFDERLKSIVATVK
ncbi:MAG: type II toxin-antitoxin system VapC family toxin [Candidatus Njordarchaeota archaeon]